MAISLKMDDISSCPKSAVLALTDCLNILNGKWKTPIIGSLMFGKQRFKDLEESIEKITPRMLSKELKELELNNIVKRNVYNTRPVLIDYELTESGMALKPVLEAMVEWGVEHRKIVLKSFNQEKR